MKIKLYESPENILDEADSRQYLVDIHALSLVQQVVAYLVKSKKQHSMRNHHGKERRKMKDFSVNVLQHAFDESMTVFTCAAQDYSR